LEIEYKPSALLDTAKSEECNDWISSLSTYRELVWVTAMDGSISVVQEDGLTEVAQDNKPVLTVKATGDLVLTGGLNHQLKGWTLKGECTLIGLGHQDSITSVDAHADQIVTGSHDHTVKLWSTTSHETGKSKLRKIAPLGTANGHTQPVTCVKLTEQNIISSSLDHSFGTWKR